MRPLTTMQYTQTLFALLHRMAQIGLLLLAAIVVAACSRSEAPPPPTVVSSTPVTTGQSPAVSSPDLPANPSPTRFAVQSEPSPSPRGTSGTLVEFCPELSSLATASSFTITESGDGMI